MKTYIVMFLFVAAMGCNTVSQNRTPLKELIATQSIAKEMIWGDVIATATIEPRSGSTAGGHAWFAKSKDGLQIFVSVHNVAPGFHGIHIHEHGDCSAADAKSAGEHFNPSHLPHGALNPMKFHLGDFGNIVVNENGIGILNLAIPNSRLPANFDWNELFHTSIVLHGGPDDLESQPSGNSGTRIGCGVVIKRQ